MTRDASPSACRRPPGRRRRAARGDLARHLVDHWHGRLPLAFAFWIDLVALRALVFALQSRWSGGETPARGAEPLAVAAALLVAHGALFLWQGVGALRAADAHARESGAHMTALGARLGVVALFVLTLLWTLEGWQTTLPPPVEEDFAARTDREHASRYTLGLADGGRTLVYRGRVAPGATRRVAALLDGGRPLERVVLESPGGNVYEGRGLARLFREHALATHVEGLCASACAIAYIGGSPRTLAPGARFGLHRYRIDAARAGVVADPARAQARDQRLYAEAGVAASFVSRMFDAGADTMWWPDTAELLRAGVAHAVTAAPQAP